MHNPSDQPRPSIYFPYRVYPAYASSGTESRAPVVISGAGPAGLVTALELARHGVRCVVLNAQRQFSQGSRAIVFTRRSLEILQQVGVAQRLMDHGLPWRFGNSYYRGQRVFRMEAPHDAHDRFFPMLNIQQQFLEQFLYEACEQQPLIEVRWGNALVGLQPRADGVALTVDTPTGPYTLETDWLVAADGGRSFVRSQLGLGLEGASYAGYFVIADIQVDLPLPTERLAYFDPEWNRGNTILMHREPHGIWRVDYQLPPGETPEQALEPASLKARIDAQLAMIGYPGIAWEMDWSSVYSARALTLAQYVHQRIVFCGDAAHLLPIFGVRGANTAFQDAQSLGWHLAHVCKGLASEAFMMNYSQERVAAAREIIDEAGKSTRFMTPPSHGFRVVRDAVLSLSLTQAFVRPLYHWRTSRPHAYTHSALNAAHDDDALFTAGPAHGAPPVNVHLGQHGYLLDHLGGGFDLLVFDPATLTSQLEALLSAWHGRGLAVRVVLLTAQAVTAVNADTVLHDPLEQAKSRYGVTTQKAAYLLRPDQHIAARWHSLSAAGLDAALHQALGQAQRNPSCVLN